MLTLVLGLVLFFAAHSFPRLRSARAGLAASLGEMPAKGVISIVSLIGFVLIIWGFGAYRAAGMIPVWSPPQGLRHVTYLLVWLAFISFAAGGPRPSRIKGWVKHPQLTGLTLWSAGHLLANGDLGGILLFGAFLTWAVFDRIAVTAAGDPGAEPQAGFTVTDLVILILGSALFLAMLYLHPLLIGVSVM